MSQENVEVVRLIYETFLNVAPEEQVSADTIRAGMEMGPWTADVEWDSRDVQAWGFTDLADVYYGAEGGVRAWGAWLEAWTAVQFDYELHDAGDAVIALIDQRMRGRSTGIEVYLGKHAQRWDFRDGLVARWKIYASQDEALKAVGLSE